MLYFATTAIHSVLSPSIANAGYRTAQRNNKTLLAKQFCDRHSPHQIGHRYEVRLEKHSGFGYMAGSYNLDILVCVVTVIENKPKSVYNSAMVSLELRMREVS